MNIFITGIASNVGKTFMSAALASIMQSLSYKTAVYKPIQLGAYEQNSFMVAPDIAFIKKIDPYITAESTYLLKNKLQPVLSAEIENIKINPKVIMKDFSMLSTRFDAVIIDGVGELMTPIAPRFTIANLIKMMNADLVIVSPADEKVVTDTIMTVNYASALGIKVNGVIINKYPAGSNDTALKTMPRLIEEYTEIPVIGMVKELKSYNEFTPASIIENVLNGVDVEKVFGIKIPKLDIG